MPTSGTPVLIALKAGQSATSLGAAPRTIRIGLSHTSLDRIEQSYDITINTSNGTFSVAVVGATFPDWDVIQFKQIQRNGNNALAFLNTGRTTFVMQVWDAIITSRGLSQGIADVYEVVDGNATDKSAFDGARLLSITNRLPVAQDIHGDSHVASAQDVIDRSGDGLVRADRLPSDVSISKSREKYYLILKRLIQNEAGGNFYTFDLDSSALEEPIFLVTYNNTHDGHPREVYYIEYDRSRPFQSRITRINGGTSGPEIGFRTSGTHVPQYKFKITLVGL